MGFFMKEQEVEAKLAAIPHVQVKAALKDAFAGLASGQSVQPPQTVLTLPGDDGDCIFYPAALWSNNLIGVKTSPYLTGLARSADTRRPRSLC